MSGFVETCQICCGVTRIALYTLYQKLCCKKSAPPRPEFSVVCVGLSQAGKTTLLRLLAHEKTTDIEPTTGFSIKPVQFKDVILNVKEIGGGDKVRPFWKHYYKGTQAVVFVVDVGSSEEDLEKAGAELHKLLTDPSLSGIPCLILANCTDKPTARSPHEIKEELDLEAACSGRTWLLHTTNYKDVMQIRDGFERLNMVLLAQERGDFTSIKDICDGYGCEGP